jgi:hypothetical protein
MHWTLGIFPLWLEIWVLPSHVFRSKPIAIIMMHLIILILLLNASRVLAACSNEFETCAMNRDCCDGLHCAMGDWASSTDSTCLSDRSDQLNALDMSDKIGLIRRFYSTLNDGKKTSQEAEALATKYSNKRQFAQLVVRLEKKYQVDLDLDKSGPAKEEL